MDATALYPLRFEPLYQYRLWGSRRLGRLLSEPLPGDGPIGEAWLLSDRADEASRVADDPPKGKTVAELTAQSPVDLLGDLAGRFIRFPLLLKLLDVKQPLSVQVHPPDACKSLIPIGETGKTEAWVIFWKPGRRLVSMRAGKPVPPRAECAGHSRTVRWSMSRPNSQQTPATPS